MFPRIILGEHGSGVLSLPGSVSFSFLRLHLAFSLLLRHLAFSSNVFSITPFKCHAALSHRRRSQSKPQERGGKKKKLASSAELTALQQMVADNTPFISLHQPVSRLFSTAPVCFLNTDCPSEKTALQDGSSLTLKQKQKVQIHTFDSGLFLRQKRKWKFPSVKLPPAIRPLISGVIFSFCFFVLM